MVKSSGRKGRGLSGHCATFKGVGVGGKSLEGRQTSPCRRSGDGQITEQMRWIPPFSFFFLLRSQIAYIPSAVQFSPGSALWSVNSHLLSLQYLSLVPELVTFAPRRQMDNMLIEMHVELYVKRSKWSGGSCRLIVKSRWRRRRRRS